ncbi:MAG TPA: cytochrome c oxidase assembly protein [Hyphomicrobiaceae bacterium]|nr:cytochrome c oxidase assembly protein [Hyphomicrobiaceae bacterium]
MPSFRQGTPPGTGVFAPQPAWPAAGAISAAAAVALLIAVGLPLPPLSRHMAVHILLMNLAGPIFAFALSTRVDARVSGKFRLALPTTVQLGLLWAWHTPAALAMGHGSHFAHTLMHGTLLVSAVWFWSAIFLQIGTERWRAIAALLITGKVFCLLGALLTFAPRELYLISARHGPEHALSLEDQQLAGLLMLAACPATYVLAGVVLAVRWLDELARDGR